MTTLNIDSSKSFATEATLTAKLATFGLADHRYVVVCNREGRFTAIFPLNQPNGDIRPVHQGFLVLG